jgi:hypothetical protein
VIAVAARSTLPRKSFAYLHQPVSKIAWERGEAGKKYSLHPRLLLSLHLVAVAIGCLSEGTERRESESHRGKNTKTGGSDPTFSAFSRPKSSVRSLPPGGTVDRALFFPRWQETGKKYTSSEEERYANR